MYCKICNTKNCTKHQFLVGNVRKISEFSGSSPPEIFVGEWNYPNVYAGILSPEVLGDTKVYSSPEEWHIRKLTIQEITSHRQKLIYGRTKENVKKTTEKIIGVMQQVAMTQKPIAAEFKLKKPLTTQKEQDKSTPLISTAGEIKQVKLQENVKVLPKVESLVGDDEIKSKESLLELEHSGIETSTLIKLLSAGLLGLRSNRKLVPTKWSITAVDDMLSKEKLKRIKEYPELQEIEVFHAEYVGNHYEFLLLPGRFSFEVIEISLKNKGVWQDHEGFSGRKSYADSVTGAYYANRLALTEYLERIRRQAVCLVMREVRPEYDTPLGVGILRQTSREAFSKNPEKCSSKEEAFIKMQARMRLALKEFTEKSNILKEYRKQRSLNDFFY